MSAPCILRAKDRKTARVTMLSPGFKCLPQGDSQAWDMGRCLLYTSMENNACRTAVCTCILKNKISWGTCQVKIVFLFALASSWNHTIIPVYNVMIDHLFQTSTIHKLAKIKDCQKFLDLLI